MQVGGQLNLIESHSFPLNIFLLGPTPGRAFDTDQTELERINSAMRVFYLPCLTCSHLQTMIL